MPPEERHPSGSGRSVGRGFPGHSRSWEQLGTAGGWGWDSQVLLRSGDAGRFLVLPGTPGPGLRPLGKPRGGPGALLLTEC